MELLDGYILRTYKYASRIQKESAQAMFVFLFFFTEVKSNTWTFQMSNK